MLNSSPNATRQDRALYTSQELSRLIRPASVALIGASPTPGSFGMTTLRNMSLGFEGRIFPVNPKYESVLGHDCFPSIAATPETPDCVVLAIPKGHVLKTLEGCAERGVGGAVIFSSGFAELRTSDGRELQNDIAALANATGMRICGPNCIGVVNVAQRLGMTFMTELPMVRGPIGVVSQSGGLGYNIMQAMERGVGFSHYLSPGNSCDVDVCDLINYLVDDEDTKVIAVTMEGVRNGARLIEACQRALAADKPVIACKMGKSAQGKNAALAHTGTLAGSDDAYRAAFAETGVVVVDHFEAVLETAIFFSRAGAPQARGIGVLTVSGGASVMAADRALECGVDLPPAAEETTAKLRTVVPPFGSVINPADLTAESLRNPDMYGSCITAYAEDPAFAAVVVPLMSAFKPTTVERADYLSHLAQKLDKPLCVVWLNEWLQGPGSEIYDQSPSICIFRSMGRCFATLKSWIDRHDKRAQVLADPASRISDPANRTKAEKLLAAGGDCQALSERQSKQILASYGIGVTRELFATNADDAAKAAAAIGYPVVMKAEASDIPHKSDAGLVRLDLRNEADVRAAYETILRNAAGLPDPKTMRGVVVQEMIEAGTEIMIGIKQDPQFGTVVVCSAGGILVELIGDTAVALAPIDLPHARAMIQSLKAGRLLNGVRGQVAADVDALAEALCRLSELGCDFADEIDAIDVNPVIATGATAIAADALVVRRKSGSAV